MEKTNQEVEVIFKEKFGLEISGWIAPDIFTISGRKEDIDAIVQGVK